MVKKENIEKVFHLLETAGQQPYMDVGITQLQHMIQAAMQAEKDGQPPAVVLGALLHDIGNLVGHVKPGVENVIINNVNYGPKDHDKLGEEYLKEMGFPLEVYCFAKGHVDALRYMAHKDPNYEKSFDSGKLKMIQRHGGAMNAQEAAAFEKLPNFNAVLKSRQWDVNSHEKNVQHQPLEKYKKMAMELLCQ